MRTVTVQLTVSLTIRADEGVDISNAIDEMDYNFKSQTEGADIEDSSINDFEVVNSK